MSGKFKIFISYRRKGGFDTAKLIYDRLRMDGYSVFLDIDVLEKGDFDNELEKKIKKCKDFILILSPGIFDCFSEKGYNPKYDWVRIEARCAIEGNKNIVPLTLDGFVYPRRLPDDIKGINRKNSVDLTPKHFEAGYEKLKQKFLISKPSLKVRYKRQLKYIASIVFFAAAIYLSSAVYTIYSQAKEAKEAADAIIISKEVEIARLKDSISLANKAEMSRMRDSLNFIRGAEIAKLRDSVAKYKDLRKGAQAPSPKAAAKSSAKQTAKKTSTARGSR